MVCLEMVPLALQTLTSRLTNPSAWTPGTSTHIFRLEKTHPMFEDDELLRLSISTVTLERGKLLGAVPMEFRSNNFGPPLFCNNQKTFYHLDNRQNKSGRVHDTMWLVRWHAPPPPGPLPPSLPDPSPWPAPSHTTPCGWCAPPTARATPFAHATPTAAEPLFVACRMPRTPLSPSFPLLLTFAAHNNKQFPRDRFRHRGRAYAEFDQSKVAGPWTLWPAWTGPIAVTSRHANPSPLPRLLGLTVV